VQLVADRFVVYGEQRVVDLATGAPVTLITSTAGGPRDQAAWAERCAWWARVEHRSVAPLVDFGVVGESHRFEAWAGEHAPSPRAIEQAHVPALRFLAGVGRTIGSRERWQGASCDGRLVLVPAPDAGFEPVPRDGSADVRVASHAPEDDPSDCRAIGIVHASEAGLAVFADILGAGAVPGVPAFSVWFPQGADTTRAVLVMARVARLAGYVPVDVSLFHDEVRALVDGRSLVLLARAEPEVGWRALLHATWRRARPHLVCFVGGHAVPRVHTLSPPRVSEEALVALVQPHTARRQLGRAIATAARRAQGDIGRFGRLLLDDGVSGRSVSAHVALAGARGASRAAEGTGGRVTMACVARTGLTERAWPAPGEVARLRRQAETVRSLMRAGRRQPGERLARQVMHGAARRGEWRLAVECACLLGASLRRSGRCTAAFQVVEPARTWAEACEDLTIAQQLGLLWAELLIDQARLDDAHTCLERLRVVADSTGSEWHLPIALALVRCLTWQGRFLDAWHQIGVIEARLAGKHEGGSRIAVARAMVAIGRGRAADAIGHAALARERAMAAPDPEDRAEALEACVWAQLAAGDAGEAWALGQRAAAEVGQAHHPMLRWRIQCASAEAARRLGRRERAATFLRRYARVPDALLPRLSRVRLDLLRDLLTAPDDRGAIERRAETCGLPGLVLFAPPQQTATGAADPEDVIGLLQCCEAAEDERVVLAKVAGRLRGRLNAIGVSIFGVEHGQCTIVASDGARADTAAAARVKTAGQLVLPHSDRERAHGGVPVRYAGTIVGVLVATWPPGGRWIGSDVSLLLSTAAAVAGPAVAGLLARREAERGVRASELIGISRAAAELRSATDSASSAPFPVLIEGESGAGKELVARLLHKRGPRRDRPFCTLNCAALPDDLVESELFGHARGAFTGAAADRRGVFEDAHGGTLFLDEIGELSLRAQAKLLRAIQEGEIRRVGENQSRRVDVRLVTATNRDLRGEAAAGRFRHDLLYRLDVIRIVVPPLRDRREDIPVLAEHIWREAAGRVGSHAMLAPATLEALTHYHWPGNIRELQNVLAALVVRCPKRGAVPPTALPSSLIATPDRRMQRLEAAREAFDRAFIRAALSRAGGRRSRAARELGLSRQGLAKLMARLSIDDGLEAAPVRGGNRAEEFA